MNKKLLKTGLALGSLASVAAPIAAVVSCGSNSGYSDVVLIKTSWSATGPQYKAMQRVVDEYNKTNPEKKAKLLHIQGSGYGSVIDGDSRDIKIKHMSNVSNLFIDYPDNIGTLSSLGAQLDLSTLGLKRDQFVEGFLDVNDKIEGTKGTPNTQMYYAPLGTSTEMLTADLPALSHVLKDIVDNGGTVAGSGLTKNGSDFVVNITSETGILKQALEYIDSNSTSDDAEVQSKWTLDTTGKTQFNNYAVDSDTFSSYEKILEFTTKTANAYKIDKDSGNLVLGIDAPANVVYQSIFAKGSFKYDPNNFIYGTKNSSGNKKLEAVYDGIIKSNSSAAKNVNDGLKMFNDAIESHGLKFLGGGEYTSNDLKAHRAIISWGSTSGYTHNYDGKMSGYEYKGINLSSYDKHLEGTTKTKTKAIAQTADHYHNPVYKESDKPAPLPKHSIVVPDDIAKDINTYLADNNKKGKIFLSSSSGIDKKTGVKKAYEYTSHGKTYTYFLLDPTNVVANTAGNPKTVQKEEAGFAIAPSKVMASDANQTHILQGPSFIPIHHNETMDKATVEFLKWFYDENNKIDNHGREQSIVEYFQSVAQYIVPKKGVFKNLKNFKDGNKIVAETFHNVGATNFAFQAPITKYSGQIRKKVFDVSLKDYWTNSAKVGKTHSVQDVYKHLSELAKSIIE